VSSIYVDKHVKNTSLPPLNLKLKESHCWLNDDAAICRPPLQPASQSLNKSTTKSLLCEEGTQQNWTNHIDRMLWCQAAITKSRPWSVFSQLKLQVRVKRPGRCDWAIISPRSRRIAKSPLPRPGRRHYPINSLLQFPRIRRVRLRAISYIDTKNSTDSWVRPSLRSAFAL
jgi:hypothetical protein